MLAMKMSKKDSELVKVMVFVFFLFLLVYQLVFNQAHDSN